MSICNNCGNNNCEDAKYCVKCGTKLSTKGIEQKNDLKLEVDYKEKILTTKTFKRVLAAAGVFILCGWFIYGHIYPSQNITAIIGETTSQNNTLPEDWLKENQDILDLIMDNHQDLSDYTNLYSFFKEYRNVSFIDSKINKTQKLQQRINTINNNQETEKIRMEFVKQLSGQIEALEYCRKGILYPMESTAFDKGLRSYYVMQKSIMTPSSPIGLILEKYGISKALLFSKIIEQRNKNK